MITYNQSLHLYLMFPSTASFDVSFLTDFWAIFRSLHHFLFLDNIEEFKKNLSKVLNTFENIMEIVVFATFVNIMGNGAFAPKEQMLHLP